MKKIIGHFRVIAATRIDGGIDIIIDDMSYKEGAFRLILLDEKSQSDAEAIQRVEEFLSGYHVNKSLEE